MRTEIIEKMEPIFSLSETEREQVFHDISTLYRNTVYLPERDFSNLDEYYGKYEQLQQQFIGVDTLALTYDRSTFNKTLLKALSKVCVIVSKDDNPKLKILGKEQEISISDFKNYICAIKDDNQHNANSNEFRTIHDLAFKLWKAALLCKDYELPREIAKKALQNISMKSWNPSGITIDVETHSKMIDQFKGWIQNWQYGKSAAADLKIKILFINLFKTKFNEKSTALIFDKTVYSFVTDKLQLDHMEAQKPVDSNMAKHFSPADPHEVRQKYIDSLGNIMILDNENNNDKNNKPLAEAMHYYDNMCADHWLIKEAKSLLRAYHKSVNINGVEFSVPTEKFFNERASRLRTYFERIVARDLDAKKVTVWP